MAPASPCTPGASTPLGSVMGSNQVFLIKGKGNCLMDWARQQTQMSWELVKSQIPRPRCPSHLWIPTQRPGIQTGTHVTKVDVGPGSTLDVEETEARKRTRCIQPSPAQPKELPTPRPLETFLFLALQVENLLPKERKEVGHGL